MKVILFGSRGHVGKPLTDILVSKGVDTTVITRSEQNAKAIEGAGAKAAIGTTLDKNFLVETFEGADVVFVLLAPTPTLSIKSFNDQCSSIAEAILEAKVQNVVYLSSVGAENPDLPVHFNNENILKEKLAGLHSVSFIRPPGFFTNFYGNLQTLKSDHAIYMNIVRNQLESFAHETDIAQLAADLIMNPPTDEKFKVVYIESDSAYPEQLEKMFSKALKTDIKFISVPDEVIYSGMVKAGLDPKIAQVIVNLYSEKYRTGMREEEKKHEMVHGVHKLQDFLNTEFAAAFNG